MTTRGVFGAIMRIGKRFPEILLLQRAGNPDDSGYPGTWELPGGRAEENETDEQCLIRMMLKETGFKVESLEKVSLDLPVGPGIVTDQSDDTCVYYCQVGGPPELVAFPNAFHLQGRWVSLAEIFSGLPIVTNPTSKGYLGRMAKMILVAFEAHRKK